VSSLPIVFSFEFDYRQKRLVSMEIEEFNGRETCDIEFLNA